MALQKKHKRMLAYIGILGGLAALSLTFFTISQYEKAKYGASHEYEMEFRNDFAYYSDAYLDDHPEIINNYLNEHYTTQEEKEKPENITKAREANFEAVLKEGIETNKYYEAAVFWDELYKHFVSVTKANFAAYMGVAIPAYIFSMSTLVAFGLVLKHAEKAKEKEDEEEVLRQMH